MRTISSDFVDIVLAIIKKHPEGITSRAIAAECNLCTGLYGGADQSVLSAVWSLHKQHGLVRHEKKAKRVGGILVAVHFYVPPTTIHKDSP